MNDHYKGAAMEAIDFISLVQRFLEGNNACDMVEGGLVGKALKYALRAGKKDGTDWRDDARKCADYLCRAINGRWLDECRADIECAMVDAYCSQCGMPDPSNGDAGWCAYCGCKVTQRITIEKEDADAK